MALESATYISDLVSTNPATGDALSAADDHVRLMKAVVKATLAGPTGAGLTGAVTASHTELNILDGATLSTAELNVLDGIPATLTATELGYVDGVTSAIQTQLNAKSPAASPTFSGTITTALTASRAVATGSSSELAVSATTATELGYLSGVTSAVQTQINTKSPAANPTFTGTVTTPLTASRAVVTGASSELAASAVTATEIGYVAGVTSAIQTQLDGKISITTGAGGNATLDAARFQTYTTSGGVTVNLPASPVDGDIVVIANVSGTTTIGRNGKTLNAGTANKDLGADEMFIGIYHTNNWQYAILSVP